MKWMCALCRCIIINLRDVTAAMLLSRDKGTAAKLVSPTNPQRIELNSVQTFSFVLVEKHAH